MNAILLELKMKQAKIKNDEIAKLTGMDPATFYRKKIGISDFYRKEIQLIRKILNLTPAEVDAIFFDKELTETQVLEITLINKSD